MKAILCLVLSFFSIANSNHNPDTRALNLTDPTLSFEQITQIINNPIYRENAPPRLLYPPMPESLEPLSSDNDDHKSDIFSQMPEMPPRELVAPLENAEDVYEKYASATSPSPSLEPIMDLVNKEQDSSKYSPQADQKFTQPDDQLISEITFLGKPPTAPEPSKHLELPYFDVLKTRSNYPPVPSRELETPLFEPYYEQYSGEEDIRPLGRPIVVEQELPYKENKHVFVPVISQKLQPPKYLSLNKQNPTKVYPKKYNSRINEIKKKKLLKAKPVVELINEDSNEGVRYYKSQRPQKLVEDASIARGNYNEGRELYLHKQALENQRQMYEEAQLKKREKMFNEARKQQEFLDESVSKTFGVNQEPEASESEHNTFQDGGEKTDSFDLRSETMTGM